MKFRYERFPPDDDPVYLPTLKVKIANPKTNQVSFDFKVLLDSGASVCVFHAGFGESIGLDVRSGRELLLKGVTQGEGKQYLHKIKVIIGGVETDLEAGFTYDLRIPFGLLGERGFFEKHRISFDLPTGDFEIVKKERIKKK